MATRGSYVHNSMVEFSRASRKCQFYAIFLENCWFQTKRFTGLLELIQLFKLNPLEKFFIFTIYQNYTLALKHVFFPSISKSIIQVQTLIDVHTGQSSIHLIASVESQKGAISIQGCFIENQKGTITIDIIVQ